MEERGKKKRDDSKRQDDKKFFRSDEKNMDEMNEERRKRITIPLPDLDFALQKDTESPKQDFPREPEKDTTKPAPSIAPPPSVPTTPKVEEGIRRESSERTSPILPPPLPSYTAASANIRSNFKHLVVIYILSVLLVGAIIASIYFANNTASLKQKILSDAHAVRNVVVEKERVSEKQKELEVEIERLNTDLQSAKTKQVGLQKKNSEMEAELAKSKKSYVELDEKMKDYAEEIKSLSTTHIGYYDSYQQEKEMAQQLNLKLKELEKEKQALNEKLDSVDDKFKQREAIYSYDMAFISVEAEMFDRAIQYFERFMELSGDDADIHYNLAVIYEQVKKDKYKAAEHYEKYLALSNNPPDLYETKMRIDSLRRDRGDAKSLKRFSITLDSLK